MRFTGMAYLVMGLTYNNPLMFFNFSRYTLLNKIVKLLGIFSSNCSIIIDKDDIGMISQRYSRSTFKILIL